MVLDRRLCVEAIMEALRLHVLSFMDVAATKQASDTFEKLFERLQVVVDEILSDT